MNLLEVPGVLHAFVRYDPTRLVRNRGSMGMPMPPLTYEVLTTADESPDPKMAENAAPRPQCGVNGAAMFSYAIRNGVVRQTCTAGNVTIIPLPRLTKRHVRPHCCSASKELAACHISAVWGVMLMWRIQWL